jgi:hypothetical protein
MSNYRKRMTDLELVEYFSDRFRRDANPEYVTEMIDEIRDRLLRILRRGLLMTQHDFENRPTLTNIKLPDPPRPDPKCYTITDRCSYCGNHHRTVHDGVRGCHAFKRAVLKLFTTDAYYQERDSEILDQMAHGQSVKHKVE